MRIALGSIAISNYERAAIANFYGLDGIADRDTCRNFIVQNGTGSLEEAVAVLELKNKDIEEELLKGD